MTDLSDKARRAFLRNIAAYGALVPAAGITMTAAGPALAQEHAQDGHAQNYVVDASGGVDHPRFKEGSHCANCAFWQGGDAEWGKCQHPAFRNVQVHATGWCQAYARGR